jgi:hypothetical protein
VLFSLISEVRQILVQLIDFERYLFFRGPGTADLIASGPGKRFPMAASLRDLTMSVFNVRANTAPRTLRVYLS